MTPRLRPALVRSSIDEALKLLSYDGLYSQVREDKLYRQVYMPIHRATLDAALVASLLVGASAHRALEQVQKDV